MENKAYIYSLRLLGGQEYSLKKLKTKLKLKEFSEEEIEEAIRLVVEKGYLNEERYLELKVKSLILKGKASRVVQHALSNEGITVSEARINQICEEKGVDQDQQLKELISKKLRNHKPGTRLEPSEYQKIIRFALSRGHSYQKVKKILGLSLTETEESPDFF